MVRPLPILRRYQPGLAAFRDLGSESAQELMAALQSIPSTTNSYTVSSEVANQVRTIEEDVVQEIVPALLHVHSIRDTAGLPTAELVASLTLGMEQIYSRESTEAPVTDKDSFEANLAEVLAIDQLRVIARAAGLLFEHEHTATQVRIVTDIRPIFDRESPDTPPVGAMIVHTLKITYFEDDDEKHFFVALDASDARELSEQIQRANSKAESLRSVLEVAQIPYVNSE